MERDRQNNEASILLVDDQPEITEVFKTILEDFGFRVFLAGDGYEAIEAYFKYKPDLVLMDLSLISVDGDVACEKILERDPHARIILLTALKGDKVKRALKAGAIDVITKPISAVELVKRVNFHLKG